jgi:hypothetical protein
MHTAPGSREQHAAASRHRSARPQAHRVEHRAPLVVKLLLPRRPVRQHQRVRQRVELQRLVVRPVDGLRRQRQRAEVGLLQQREGEVGEADGGVVLGQVWGAGGKGVGVSCLVLFASPWS